MNNNVIANLSFIIFAVILLNNFFIYDLIKLNSFDWISLAVATCMILGVISLKKEQEQDPSEEFLIYPFFDYRIQRDEMKRDQAESFLVQL